MENNRIDLIIYWIQQLYLSKTKKQFRRPTKTEKYNLTVYIQCIFRSVNNEFSIVTAFTGMTFNVEERYFTVRNVQIDSFLQQVHNERHSLG